MGLSAPYRDAADRPVGTVVAVHPWRTGPGWLIGILFVGIFLYLVSIAVRQEDWTTGDTLGLVVMSVVTLGIAGLMFWLSARTRGDTVTIHVDAIVQRVRGVTKTLHFDRVQSMRSDVVIRGASTVHRHTLESLDGEKILLTQIYADIDGLVAEIHARLGPLVVKRTLDALAEGKAADFGEIEMRDGKIVLSGGRELPLVEARADVDAGTLVLRRSGDRKAFASFRFESVPNAFAIADVLEALRLRA